MKTIDINADLGESFGHYSIGNDEAMLKLITSANVACGFHASDPKTLIETIRKVKAHNVTLGAHPGYRDLEGFGRRDMNLSYDEVYALVKYQIAAIDGLAKSEQVTLTYVKPHGALYNKAEQCETTRRAIVDSIFDYNKSLKLMGISEGLLIKYGRKKGLSVINEVFLDRAYKDDGTLVPRTSEGAMITDSTLGFHRVLQMIEEGRVTSVNGKKVPITLDSLCVHGDTEDSEKFLRSVLEQLKGSNIQFKSVVT